VMQAHSDDVARRVELLGRMAEIEERRLSHQKAAFEIYGRALRVGGTAVQCVTIDVWTSKRHCCERSAKRFIVSR